MSARLNIQFTDTQKQSLDEMAVELGTTKAGVLKTALSLLKVAIQEREQKNHIAVTRDGKVVKEIVGILDI